MKYMTGSQVRKAYLDFFASHGHMVVKSKSLVPHNDPSLLWINSGVAAIKTYFDGTEKAPAPRLVNSQKSIRTNDIENVGITARHHTLFEMMGNFSIGDYFKEDGIKFQWEFLTKVIGLEVEKLYVTVYKDDAEAYRIWTEVIGLSDDRIIKNGKDKNFWEIGAGPCGPNTEIFYDRGVKYDPENIGLKLLIEDLDNDRYLEVVNVVFSEFNNDGEGNYTPLPMQNIDTGLGLERLTSIVQQTPTNFDTDFFLPIIKEIEKYTNKKYDTDNFFKKDKEQEQINIAFKVIADHIRANVFAISDGVIPSNKDRGYILRRLIRRAVKWARKLDINKPFLGNLVDVVVHIMNDFYPEIIERKDFIKKVITKEEEQFLETINNGEQLLKDELAKYQTLPGDVAFKLFDTFGFPIELTQEIAQESGKDVDLDGFNNAFEKHKEVARAAHKSQDSMAQQNEELMNINVKSEFVGYETCEIETTVNFAVSQNGKFYIMLEKTPFYATSGGQVADGGKINGEEVIDVFKGPKGEHIHVIGNELKVGQAVNTQVIGREFIASNHTATHIIHQALKDVLGKDVNQAGSYVDGTKLRFDFVFVGKLSQEDISKVEEIANKEIAKNQNVVTDIMDIESAKKSGAIGLFEDKYGDSVRVCSVGNYSKELCGGIHVNNTSEIERVAFTSVESKGSGVYRLEAITKEANVANYFAGEIAKLGLTQNFENTRSGLNDALILFAKNKEQENEAKKLAEKESAQKALTVYSNMEDNSVVVNGKNLLVIRTENVPSNILKELADNYKNKSEIIVVLADAGEKLTFVVGVCKEYVAQGINAGTIVKELSDGKGGGKPDLAQGGLPEVKDIDRALEKLANLI